MLATSPFKISIVNYHFAHAKVHMYRQLTRFSPITYNGILLNVGITMRRYISGIAALIKI